MLDIDYEDVTRSNRGRSDAVAFGLSAAGWAVALPLEWSKTADVPSVLGKSAAEAICNMEV
jgi:hypothetical protein